MTKDEINKKQEETLNNLKKYNKTRNTEIVDDPEEIKWEAPTRELVIEDGNAYDSFFALECPTGHKYFDVDEPSIWRTWYGEVDVCPDCGTSLAAPPVGTQPKGD